MDYLKHVRNFGKIIIICFFLICGVLFLLVYYSEGLGTMAMRLALCNYACLPCAFKPRLVQVFRETWFSPLNVGTLFRCLCLPARYFNITFFTWLRYKQVPGKTEMQRGWVSDISCKLEKNIIKKFSDALRVKGVKLHNESIMSTCYNLIIKLTFDSISSYTQLK